MQIEQQWTDEVLVLSVRGKLNTEHRAETLRQTIDDVVAQGHLRLMIDVRRVRRLDRVGLDTLLHCLQRVRRAGGDLKLVGVTRPTGALIAISGLLRVFDVQDTVTAAVRAFERMQLLAHPVAARVVPPRERGLRWFAGW